MRSVAAAITVAIKPAPAVAIAAKNECQNKGHTDTHQHRVWVIKSRRVKVKEEIHAPPFQETEAIL